jgi:hypothetical protein
VSEVVYELEIEDVIAFNMHHRARSAVAKRVRWLLTVLLLILAAVAARAGVTAIGENLPAAAVFFLILAVIAAFASLFSGNVLRALTRRSVRNFLREGSNRAILGTRRLQISTVGLSKSSELIETKAKWAAVEKIDTTREYAYFYIASIEAYVVPRRAFNDDLQFQAFVELARRYWRQATVAPSPAARALA